MRVFNILLGIVGMASAGPPTETHKDQFCTDPRTMRKHAAYTEWADAYSCTRHRCQPGGRDLAIYTVGCKRVEAPESAIECEEVVEDTNMQFPFCCTRLRCLVVVRGEVWTRVLGQPWETLPAAPWSHMYKMKKPPPSDTAFLSKSPGGGGPVYELQTSADSQQKDKVLRASKKDETECHDARKSGPSPDIVIALSTNSEKKTPKKNDNVRLRRGRKSQTNSVFFDDDAVEARRGNDETEEAPEKSERKDAWTEIPQSQWNENGPSMEAESSPKKSVSSYHQPEYPPSPEVEPEITEKPGNFQALVDAIGSRMRDIEHVVQRMSEKVKSPPTNDGDFSSADAERRPQPDTEILTQNHHSSKEHKNGRVKKPNPDGAHYKRFSKHGSKYIHGAADATTEKPLFVEDAGLNGYFSDASNTILRRAPKEPAVTYMAPVDSHRKAPAPEASEEGTRRKKHKRRRGKSGHHKKHHRDERKRFNRLNSVELEKNVVSLEDSGAVK